MLFLLYNPQMVQDMTNFKHILFLLGVILLAYYPILGNRFLDFWDDQWVVIAIQKEE